MRVLITGITGLIGQALAQSLHADGHETVGLSRHAGPGLAFWNLSTGEIDRSAVGDVDAVVHLAGESVGKRWTDTRRAAILDSRVRGTELIASLVAEQKPDIFVSSSAIGYYGDRGDEVLTEESSKGSGFLSDVCQVWEASASAALDAGVPTAFVRTGLVLSKSEGILPRFLLLFKSGLGGRLGSGAQYMSWISLVDEVRAIRHILGTRTGGIYNLTAPHPVTNDEFTRVLAAELSRPAVVPAPAFAMRAVLGSEFAEQMVLAGQRVMPEALSASGFEFSHADVGTALRSML